MSYAMLLLFAVATGGTPDPATPPAPRAQGAAAATPEATAIVGAIEAMYAAWARDDLDAFHAVATPDFHAFDNGRRYDGDALADVLRAAHASGRTHVWTVTEPEVHVDGDSAWVAYVNRGSITQGQETKAATWLESVMLRREQGAWKVAFLHSTRAP